MKTVRYTSYVELNAKEWAQLLKLCTEFQPHEPFEDIVFLEVVTAARKYCDSSCCGYCVGNERFEGMLLKDLNRIKFKYYFNNIKSNKTNLTARQVDYMDKYIPRVKMPLFTPLDGYRPVEKVLFLKVIRACRDFMRAKMSKDAEQVFYEKLNVVYNALML